MHMLFARKKSPPVETWIQILVVALVVSAAAWYLQEHSRVSDSSRPLGANVPVPVTGDELPVPVPSDWKYFRSPDGGFEFRYPASAKVVAGAGEGMYLDETIDTPTAAFSVVFPRVDTFSENGSHGYYEQRLRIFFGVPEFGCNPAASGFDKPAGTATVAGMQAYVFERSDAGAGNRMEARRYAFCDTRGAWYSIEDIFASGSDGTPLTPKLEVDITRVRADAKSIINSFQLL
jgi:hypothetical protein